MLSLAYAFARAALFRFEPEQAHEMTLRALENGIYPRPFGPDDRRLGVRAFGLDFPNPLGIAAGFDKDARVPDAVLGMGCGFAEIGTITPLAQVGNPQPRVFRLIEAGGLINRLGFNNGGHAATLARLEARRNHGGIVGINLGANKDTTDKTADYVLGLKTFYDFASYVMINISSPNTPGLRDLQAPDALDELLGRVMAERTRLIAGGAPSRPIIVKISPDIAADDLEAIVARLIVNRVDGIAVSNTTLSRPGLSTSQVAQQAGGLSGRPLFHRSTVVLARVHELTAGKVPLIGIGGIHSAASALAKIKAGATLLQLYTGLIYEGPALIGQIKAGLVDALRGENAGAGISALVGRDAKTWAAHQLEG